MRLESLRVRNYKTVVSEAELGLDSEGSVLVGANNSGKSNLLKAISLFFKKDNDEHYYKRDKDFPFNGDSRQKTSFIATFSGDAGGDPRDGQIFQDYDKLRSYITDASPRLRDEIQLSLQVSPSEKFTYQFFPNQKQRNAAGAERTQFSRLQTSLVDQLLSSFECNYIEAQKDAFEIHERILMPHVKNRAAVILESHKSQLMSLLDEISRDINTTMEISEISNLSASIKLPPEGFSELLGNFVVEVDDASNTPLGMKGHGIQSTVLFASLPWVSKQIAQSGKTPIWLIEEPEAFMHPSLAHQSARVIDSLAELAQVVTTTHSTAFVPQSQDRVIGVTRDEGGTKTEKFRNYHSATLSIRSSLGIKFGDYFSLRKTNIFVEGITDQKYLEWITSLLLNSEGVPMEIREAAAEVSRAQILELGGTTDLCGFMRSNYKFIKPEHAVVCVLDGDEAGKKAARDLNQYLSRSEQINFAANEDYVLVRDGFEVEGLFPDEWIIEKHEESEGWFESYSVDATGNTVTFFKIKDNKKQQYMSYMMSRAESESVGGNYSWLDRWAPVLTVIGGSLRKKAAKF